MTEMKYTMQTKINVAIDSNPSSLCQTPLKCARPRALERRPKARQSNRRSKSTNFEPSRLQKKRKTKQVLTNRAGCGARTKQVLTNRGL